MTFLFIILFIIMFCASGFFRFILCKLYKFLGYFPIDVKDYFKHKRYNECKAYGHINIYTGYFGSGKTLSCVNDVVNLYKRYNDKDIYIDDMHTFVKQKITIISNINLYGIPYVNFTSEQQCIDYETEVGEVLIFLIDEIGTVWNSRDFKNFNPEVFNNIVQSRKRKICIYGTLPVFAGTDINIRRYTDTVYHCEKFYRVLKKKLYDGFDIENTTNLLAVQPLKVFYTFVTNKMYKQYDTEQLVNKLKIDMANGKFLTFNELKDVDNNDNKIVKLKKKFRKRVK